METSEIKGKPELRMSRTFDAPLHLVWEAWSKAEHVARWFTPSPGTSHGVTVDLRAGGDFILTMKFPGNFGEHTMKARFAEVVPKERIVFDARIGEIDVHTIVTFREEGGKTTLDVLQQYSGESDATRGAHAGWTSTLDNLAAHLRGHAAS